MAINVRLKINLLGFLIKASFRYDPAKENSLAAPD